MADEKLSTGVVTDVVEFVAGDRLEFQSMPFPPLINASDMPQEHFDGALVHIHVGTKETNAVFGNAALVAPGVAIGAKHVIAKDLDDVMAGRISIFATAMAKDGRVDYWDVRHIMFDEDDLAIYSLVRRSALPESKRLTLASLSTRLPAEGEPVMIVGFKWEDGSFSHEDGRDVGIVKGHVHASIGVVGDRYPHGRDRSVIPWPCFEVRVGTHPGMSGGPAFDVNGDLVGVLTSGFGDGDDPEGISYVSMVHPALWRPFKTAWPNGLFPESTTLLEINPLMCHITGRDRVYTVLDLNGDSKWYFDHWS